MDDIIYNGFCIRKTKTGFRVTRNDGSDVHSHLINISACYKLIDNVNHHKLPKKCREYYITSHIRVSNNKEYTRKLEEYLKVKQNKGKKQNYYNPSKKKF